MQLQYNGIPLPFPHWFIQGDNAGNTQKVNYLENVSAYIGDNTNDNYNVLLNEFNQKNVYKPHGRPPDSASMIWYVLHLRYTSLQVNRLFLEKCPMLSFPLLDKIQ